MTDDVIAAESRGHRCSWRRKTPDGIDQLMHLSWEEKKGKTPCGKAEAVQVAVEAAEWTRARVEQ